jgi:hypothetical protein
MICHCALPGGARTKEMPGAFVQREDTSLPTAQCPAIEIRGIRGGREAPRGARAWITGAKIRNVRPPANSVHTTPRRLIVD